MARKAKGLPSGDLRLFIPEVKEWIKKEGYHNRQDPEPIKIWIRNPNSREKRELLIYNRSLVFEDGKPKVGLSGESDRHHLSIERFVEKVENYTANDDTPITNGEELALHADDEVFFEVSNEIIAAASVGKEEKKDLGGSLSTSTVATHHSIGTVKTAENKSSSKSETAVEPKKGLHTSSLKAV